MKNKLTWSKGFFTSLYQIYSNGKPFGNLIDKPFSRTICQESLRANCIYCYSCGCDYSCYRNLILQPEIGQALFLQQEWPDMEKAVCRICERFYYFCSPSIFGYCF